MIYELAKKLLSKGIVIKLHYTDSGEAFFKVVCYSKHAKLFGIKRASTELTDVITEQPVMFDGKTVTGFENLYVPKYLFLDDFQNHTEITNIFGTDFLLQSKHYIETTIKKIREERARFILYSMEQLEPCNSLSDELLSDYYFVKFYPEKRGNLTKDETYNKIKADSTKKYFFLKDRKSNEVKPPFKKLGILNTSENIEDPEYIKSFKNIWYSIIEGQKKEQLHQIQITKNNLLKASGIDREDFLQQCDTLESMINEVNKDILSNCNSVAEIIKIWPNILQPEPWFMEHEASN